MRPCRSKLDQDMGFTGRREEEGCCVMNPLYALTVEHILVPHAERRPSDLLMKDSDI